jgi:hypothetical protein
LNDAMMRAAQVSHASPSGKYNNFSPLNNNINSSNNKNVRIHRSGSISISASPLNVKDDDESGWGESNQIPMSPSLLDLASAPLY